MVTTVADTVRDAYRLGGLLGPGEEPTPNEESLAIRHLQTLILALPGMQHWTEVETAEDYTAGENQRVRVTTQDAVTVTVPDAVTSARTVLWCCNQTELVCEGYDDRAPQDGARVSIADVYSDDHATFYYRADIAQWTLATSLARASEIPLSADMDRYLAAILAVQMGSTVPTAVSLNTEGRQRMWTRYTQKRAHARVDYF